MYYVLNILYILKYIMYKCVAYQMYYKFNVLCIKCTNYLHQGCYVCGSVCLFVCGFVSNITQKLMNR